LSRWPRADGDHLVARAASLPRKRSLPTRYHQKNGLVVRFRSS
jgi:hypothetical protein